MSYKSYFTFKELTHTDTGLSNHPSTWEHITNLLQLEVILSSIREQFGEPIIVNSAFRTPEVNKAVKGSENSYHLQGRAADIRPSYVPSCDYEPNLLRLLHVVNHSKFVFKEIICYPTFIHISI